jgi:hypothetical protein
LVKYPELSAWDSHGYHVLQLRGATSGFTPDAVSQPICVRALAVAGMAATATIDATAAMMSVRISSCTR